MTELFVAGLIGDPVDHSISPEIFRFISKELGNSIVYRKIRVNPQKLASSVRWLQSTELLGGWNVTIPHKQKITSFLERCSKEVQVLGAANVVHLKKGKLHGYNTDIIGVLKTLQEQEFRIKGCHAVVFGAGGAALAVGYALGKGGANRVYFSNRSPLRARSTIRRLAKAFPKTKYLLVQKDELNTMCEDIGLFVNATPLGMKGFPKKSLLPENISPRALAFDLVYRPEETVFLKDAQKKGVQFIGGLDMLIWQAIAAWKIWMGEIPREAQLKSKLQLHLRSLLSKGV